MEALLGFLAGVLVCAVIWFEGDRAERNFRIARARLRSTLMPPHIGDAVAVLQVQRERERERDEFNAQWLRVLAGRGL